MANFTVVISNKSKLTHKVKEILEKGNELLNVTVEEFPEYLKLLVVRNIYYNFWNKIPQAAVNLLSDYNFSIDSKGMKLIEKEKVVKINDITKHIDFVSLNDRAELLRSRYNVDDSIPVVFYIAEEKA